MIPSTPIARPLRLTMHYSVLGNHVHARLYVSGALSGSLVFTVKEFDQLQAIADRARRSGCDIQFFKGDDTDHR